MSRASKTMTMRVLFWVSLLTLTNILIAYDESVPDADGVTRGGFNPDKRGLKQNRNAHVMVIPVNDQNTKYGMIDDWQANFVIRRLERAKRDGCDLVILEINTYGGSIESCEKINAAIAKAGVPVIAFVSRTAFSGGAIISLGCKAIVMAPTSQIGGAKAVGPGGETITDDHEMRVGDMTVKVNDHMRAMARSLCQANGYPVPVGLGMVDRDVEILETSESAERFMTGQRFAEFPEPKPQMLHKWKGKDSILTLSAKEAREAGLSSGTAGNIDQVLLGFNITPSNVEIADITPSEVSARFVSHPVWRVLLVLAGLIALVIELKSPGHGIGYIVFAFCLGVFFWLQIFSNNAGLLELGLFALGAILLALELFVVTGFGFTGIAGIAMILTSIILAFIPEGSLWNLLTGQKMSGGETQLLVEGTKWAMLTLLAVCAAIVVAWVKGTSLPGLSRMALRTEVAANVHTGVATARSKVPVAGEKTGLVGQSGVAETVLRPAGKVRLGGLTMEAVSEGAFIEAGASVVVLRVNGKTLIVRAV